MSYCINKFVIDTDTHRHRCTDTQDADNDNTWRPQVEKEKNLLGKLIISGKIACILCWLRWRMSMSIHLALSCNSKGLNSIFVYMQSFIYIIISKNIRYLLWNRGARRFLHDTYLTIAVQGIRCTNHLHDSCPLTDVNPHFTAPGCRYYFKSNSWWPIVTSSTHGPAASYCDVTMIHCSHGYLWTHDVEVDAS